MAGYHPRLGLVFSHRQLLLLGSLDEQDEAGDFLISRSTLVHLGLVTQGGALSPKPGLLDAPLRHSHLQGRMPFSPTL